MILAIHLSLHLPMVNNDHLKLLLVFSLLKDYEKVQTFVAGLTMVLPTYLVLHLPMVNNDHLKLLFVFNLSKDYQKVQTFVFITF